jgi:hypothetical protein
MQLLSTDGVAEALLPFNPLLTLLLGRFANGVSPLGACTQPIALKSRVATYNVQHNKCHPVETIQASLLCNLK